MRQVRIEGLGIVEVPDNMSDKEVELVIRQQILPQYGVDQSDRSGLMAGLKSGMHGMGAALSRMGAGAANMVGLDSARDSMLKTAHEQEVEAGLDLPLPKSFDSVSSTYRDKGLLSAGAEALGVLGEKGASFVPSIAPMLIPGGGWGATAARVAGLALPQIGINIGHQIEEGAAPQDISMAKAVPAAALQTAMFYASEGMIAKPLNEAMGRVGLKAAMKAMGSGAEAAAKETAAKKLTQIASDSIRHGLKGAAAQGAAMAGVTGVEHLQALQPGQSWMDKGPAEMLAGAKEGALFGGAMGTALGGLHGTAERKAMQARTEMEKRVEAARNQPRDIGETPGMLGARGAELDMTGTGAADMWVPEKSSDTVPDATPSTREGFVRYGFSDPEVQQKIAESPQLQRTFDSLHAPIKDLFAEGKTQVPKLAVRMVEDAANEGLADSGTSTVFLRAKPDVRATFQEELTHLLRKAMSPQEQSLLEREAARTGVWTPDLEARYRKAYGALDPKSLTEALGDEAAAHLMGAVADGSVALAGKPRHLIERTQREAGKLANLFRGLGYQDAADVADRIRSGEIGKREFFAPESRTIMAPQQRDDTKRVSDAPVVEGTPEAENLAEPMRLSLSTVKADDTARAMADSIQFVHPESTFGTKLKAGQEKLKELKSNEVPEGQLTTKRQDFFDLFRINVLDHRARVDTMERLVKDINPELTQPKNSAAYAVRLGADRSAPIGDAVMLYGMPRYRDGLIEIMRDQQGNAVDAQGKPAEGMLKAVSRLIDAAPEDQKLAGFVMGAYRAESLPVEKRGQYTPEVITKAMEVSRDNPWIKETLDQFKRHNDAVVDLLRDTGVIHEKVAEKWKADPYVPFYRHLEDAEASLGPNRSKSLKSVEWTPKLKGGDQQLGDPIENMTRNLYAGIDVAARNVADQRIIRNAQILGWAKEVKGQTGPDIVSLRVQGEKRSFRVTDPLLLKSMSGYEVLNPTIAAVFAKPASWLRQGVTMMPSFWVSNVVRDAGQNMISSGRDIGGVRTIMRGIAQSVKTGADVLRGKEVERGPENQALHDAGITGGINIVGANGDIKSNVLSEYRRRFGELPDAQDPSFIPHVIGRVVEAMKSAAEESDSVVREKVYGDALAKTGSRAQALYESLETLNFGRHGIHPLTKFLTMSVPFLNARMQGLDVLYRAASGKSPHSDPATVQSQIVKRGLATAMMVGAYSLVMPGYKAYDNANQEERDNYLFIPIHPEDKNTEMVRVPIPFEVGTLFKTVPERAMQYFMGVDTAADLAKSAKSNVLSVLAFDPMPQVAKPLWESGVLGGKENLGWDPFRQRPVVDRATSSMQPEYQFTDTTSEMAKLLGKATGIAPDKLDYIVKGYTGTMGKYFLDLSSALMRSGSKRPDGPETAPYESPFALGVGKRFIQRPDSGGKINKFYDLADDVDRLVQTVTVMQKQGRTEELKDVMERDGKKLGLKDYVTQTKSRLAEIRRQERMIWADSAMTPADKREALKNLRAMRISIAESESAIPEEMKR